MSNTLAAGAVCSVCVVSPGGVVLAAPPGTAGAAAPEVPGAGLVAGDAAGAAFGGAFSVGDVEDEAPDCCAGAGAALFAPGC
jgi:hypothetical protein